jgi:hypothetical protein
VDYETFVSALPLTMLWRYGSPILLHSRRQRCRDYILVRVYSSTELMFNSPKTLGDTSPFIATSPNFHSLSNRFNECLGFIIPGDTAQLC